MELNVRAVACQTLHDVVIGQKSLAALLPEAMKRVSDKDKGLLQEIVFGTCRWYFDLEALHNKHLKKRLSKDDQMAGILMKVGAYQLIFTRIPGHAAIHETVEATKQLGLDKFTGLVNAILRKIAKADNHSMSAKTSHPQWMQEKLSHNWPDQANQIFEQNNQHPPMTLRVNQQKTSVAEYLELLKDAEIEGINVPFSKSGITLDSPCDVAKLPKFAKGYVSVQDEAAQLCCDLLDLQPSMKVLDACAAPGGKTCAMLETEPSLSLTALDCDAARSKRITENLERLQLNAKMLIADAMEVESWWDQEQFDRILLDAPCSATGVIRRHPDIKLLRKQEDLKQLAEVQLKLLHSLWPTLKDNGKLLYATCSIFPQENSRIIERFLKQESTAKLLTLDTDWGIDTGFGRQLLPQDKGHDGFFYACLYKDEEN